MQKPFFFSDNIRSSYNDNSPRPKQWIFNFRHSTNTTGTLCEGIQKAPRGAEFCQFRTRSSFFGDLNITNFPIHITSYNPQLLATVLKPQLTRDEIQLALPSLSFFDDRGRGGGGSGGCRIGNPCHPRRGRRQHPSAGSRFAVVSPWRRSYPERVSSQANHQQSPQQRRGR